MSFLKNFGQKLLLGGGVFFDLTKWVIMLAVIIILVTNFLFSFFIVDGLSMEPNMHDKELILLRKNAYNNKDPKRGDIVVVGYPGDPENKKYVKRVIGLPNEKISIKNGKVYINNVVLHESYISLDVPTRPDGSWNMGNKDFFLMGDNRENSNDSRYFGAVEKRFFVGQSIGIIYPRFRSF